MIQTNLTLLLIGLLVVGCQSSNTDSSSSLIRTQYYGDSLKVETEVKRDVTIKRYTDLYGTSDDGFNNSYEVYLTYQEKLNKTEIFSDFSMSLGDYTFKFDRSQAIDFSNKKISELTEANEIPPIIEKYEQLKSIAQEEEEINTFPPPEQEDWLVDLLTYGEYSITHTSSQKEPKSVLVEFYRTSFSGGREFSVITEKGDTVWLLHYNDWMN